MDDILIYSNTLEEHIKHIRLILDALRDNALFTKPSKCELIRSQVTFLGHIVGNGLKKIDPSITKAIREWPTPKSAKAVQRFLGLCNFSRDFIKRFSHNATPLYHLTKEGVDFVWSPECESAFHYLKGECIKEKALLLPKPNYPYKLRTDAS